MKLIDVTTIHFLPLETLRQEMWMVNCDLDTENASFLYEIIRKSNQTIANLCILCNDLSRQNVAEFHKIKQHFESAGLPLPIKICFDSEQNLLKLLDLVKAISRTGACTR